ncbi:DUF1702 family protein [Solwaraspora sp. WMMA2101]|uniref:DUF1702 family protein n=1 Tax=Solwaraspora sp. WMMA2101 TaxID=3404124 RepID=UPI003B95A338
MAGVIGAVRRLALAPPLAEVTFARRGFPGASAPAARRLEAVPQAVICGFEWAIDSTDLWELERRLELVEQELRGFAYEGATMALTVRDVTGARRGRRTRDLLTGSGRPHLLLAYIGIGFAMARLPRPLWRKVLPDLAGLPYHPTMSWLAVDGLGFDRAYFHTRRWVVEQRQPAPYPWLGRPDYFGRAFDQGIGRALWFIHGGQPRAVAAAVEEFAPARRADLFSGVGLAATFAGGELDLLPELAGPYRAELAQGAVFAAKARAESGFVPAHVETATQVLTGTSAAAAAALADEVAVTDTDGTDADDTRSGAGRPDGPPAYETWRRRIRERFAPGLHSTQH